MFDDVYKIWAYQMRQYYKVFIIDAAKKRREDDKNAKIMEEQRIKNEKDRLKKAEESKVVEEKKWRGSNTANNERSSTYINKSSVPVTTELVRPQATNPPPVTRNINPKPAENPSGFIRNTNAVIEERKTEPTMHVGPKKFTNTKKKPQETDKDGFITVTKDSHHG